MQDKEIKKLREINQLVLFEKCKKLNLPVFEDDELELLQLFYSAAIENQKFLLDNHPKESSN